ncbi:MAG: hypothetical protein SGBAC_010248 [Bacillariaceae sp.]
MSESFEYDKPLNHGTKSVTTGSVGGGGMTSASSDSNTMSEVQETTHMLQRDHKVRRIRIITIVVLCVAAASVCGGVYSGLKRSEQREFDNRFADQAQQIGHTLETELDNKLRAIDALSVTITSFALSQQTTRGTQVWPNVTVPEFPYRAASTLSVGRAISVALQPMVAPDQIGEWEAYSVRKQQWQNEVLAFQAKFPEAIRPDEDSADGATEDATDGATVSTVSDETRVFPDVSAESISDFVFQIDNDMIPIRGATTQRKVALPLWQHAPVHSDGQLPRTNFDTYSVEKNAAALDQVMQHHLAVLGQAFELSESSQGNGLDGPAVNIYYPVFSDLNDNRTVVAVLALTTKWDSFLLPNLPPDPNGLIVTLRNECDQNFSFEITGEEVIYLGSGDYHEEAYESYGKEFTLVADSSVFTEVPMASGYCSHTATVYPSSQMREQMATTAPVFYTVATAVIFVFTMLVFVFYDYLIQKRQKYLADKATKTNAIISSLFPKIVRDRLLENGGPNASAMTGITTTSEHKKGSDAVAAGNSPNGPPIADFFANTTVMFGDIAGFTAWSSSRQPSEVFTLLETLYGKIDSIAREMNVFKVETIGDCYVAVTGLPTPQKDHHVRMVKFARRVLKCMGPLTREMEVMLGPDTTKLGFRIGLHSGPVTAGVLRGEKSRFQLFGDTVNMASRMESTGKRNYIQVSSSTAALLVAADKEHWITQREDMVSAKGKGSVQTYWVKRATSSLAEKLENNSIGDSSHSDKKSSSKTFVSVDGDVQGDRDNRIRKTLIEWQVELLSRLLKRIVAKRCYHSGDFQHSFDAFGSEKTQPRDEIADEVKMPSFNSRTSLRIASSQYMQLPPEVLDQLEDFVTSVAFLYRDNSFHNYEHACHVTMSANKFLTRVVDPKVNGLDDSSRQNQSNEYAYGLTGDPLTQFAIIFSALIHDIDHQGVSNKQLTDENNRIAVMYNGKSPAEQNSIDLAFEVLSSSQYRDLVSCICANEEELKRFRQLVVNCVMATDVFDKDLLDIRNKKWQRAFNKEAESSSDLKATIVIEHIIQAADVAHTMQHWHVYQKWNEKLFMEMCTAYDSGRGPGKDPALGWYEGELWFFDNYIIPLAKKLEECGVFGVSSDECLNYALENRKEWETRGRDLVESMKERYIEMKEGKSSGIV